MKSRPVIVLGGGGHAKVVIATLRAMGRVVLGVFDDNPRLAHRFVTSVPVLGTLQDAARIRDCYAIAAIGNNRIRHEVTEHLDLPWTIAVHPTAVIDPTVRIGPGSVVFAQAVIQPDATIGPHVIVNTRASIDHDCHIHRCVHVGPGATVTGDVVIGERSFIAAGSNVIPGITIGSDATVGAGATVVDHVHDGTVVVGCPARPLSQPPTRSAA